MLVFKIAVKSMKLLVFADKCDARLYVQCGFVSGFSKT